ncbi:MAG: HlyC/CorC family transporter, partial [Deltaproteobacteria bacterium]
TRIPVSGSSIDDIIGILHAKDLLKLWGKALSSKIPQDILRPPYFVPENKKIGELLKELKKKKNHLAIVTDEYGGTSGIITLEDIIEEIVGDIMDEHDNEEPLLVPLGNDAAYVDARLEIEKLGEFFGIELPEGNYESVGGFIIYHLGKIPKENEKIEFKDLEIIIKKADARKIHKVMVRKKESKSDKRRDE